MRFLAPACALALSACATAPARTSAAAPEGENLSRFYPLAVGNTWTYDTRFGKRVERNAVTIVAKENGFYRDDRKGMLIFDGEGLRDGSRYLIRGPLQRGATWKSQVDADHSSRFEIVDTDATITVPAGTFEHALVVKAVDDATKDGAMELQFSYAPGVGLARIATTRLLRGGERIPQLTIELVSYTLK